MTSVVACIVLAIALKSSYGVVCLVLGCLLVVVQVGAFIVRALSSGRSAEQGTKALEEAAQALAAALEAHKAAANAARQAAAGVKDRGIVMDGAESGRLADQLDTSAQQAEQASDEAAKKIEDANTKTAEAATKWTVAADLAKQVPLVVAGAGFIILGAVIMGYLKLSVGS